MARGEGNLASLFVEKALNSEVWDVEGKRYIDFGAGIAVFNTGHTHPKVTQALHDAASTISREIKRYRAVRADKQAWTQALRPKPCKLLLDARLRQAVIIKLQRYWSPQQIAGWLKRQYPDREGMHISHETIYKTLYVQARGALKRELIQYLRDKRRIRRSRNAKQKTDKRGQIKDAISISERPAEADDRAVPGHWEGDLIAGSNTSR